MKIKRKMLLLLTFAFVLVGAMGMTSDVYAVGKTYDLGSGWTMRVDNPETCGKDYYHAHFYYKGSQKYCLRLDNLYPCDSYKDNPVPKKQMKKAKSYCGSKWGYGISSSTISAGRALAIAGCAILVVIATICPFDGVAGDAVAWGLLLGVV